MAFRLQRYDFFPIYGNLSRQSGLLRAIKPHIARYLYGLYKEYEQAMKRLLVIFVAMLAFATTARTQSVLLSDTLRARFVSRTVEEFFSYWGNKYPNSIPQRTITLITDIDVRLLPDTVAGLPIKVLANEKLLRKRKNRRLAKEPIYKVRWLVPNPDTIMIDVNLVKWKVSFEGRRMRIEASCGGVLGYIPDGRFVYDEKENRWKASFYEELLEQMAKEVNAMFHSTAETTTQDGFITLSAQKVKISGHVVDSAMQESFPFVYIDAIQNDSVVAETRTDFDGNFQLWIPAGEYMLKFSAVGAYCKTVSVVVDKDTKLDTVEMVAKDPFFYDFFPSGLQIEVDPYGATQKMEVEGVKVIVR
jgi:hypothetical protein